MAKLCALLVLAALACVACGIRIDAPKLPTRVGKYFASEPRVTIDDPVCRNGNGLYPHPAGNCARYVACREGVSQERSCPEGFKFDTRRHCTPDEDADCGNPQALKIQVKSASADLTCPKDYGTFPYPGDCRKYITCDNWVPTSWMCNGELVYEQGVGCWDGAVCHDSERTKSPQVSVPKCPAEFGYFPYPGDCHQFMVCREGVPTLHTCPEGQIYQDTVGGCVDGKVCPRYAEASADRVTCRKANGLYPHEECTWYYKCVNHRPYIKYCPEGTAFDPKKEKCTKAALSRCTDEVSAGKNDLQDIMRA